MTTWKTIQERHTCKLPPGWCIKKLATLLVSLESGSRPPGGAAGVMSGIPSISAEQMTDQGTFDFSVMRYVPPDYYEQMRSGHIRKEDILIVKDGATTGKICFVDEQFPFQDAVVNEHVFICRPNLDVIIPRYLFYWLWSPIGLYAIRSTFQGAAIGGINQKFVDSIQVPVAPLEEQKRIVAVLNQQMETVKRARVAAEKRLEAAKALPAAYLRKVFCNGKLKGWSLRRLDEIARLLPSKSIATDGEIIVQVITTACLSEAGFVASGVKSARMRSKDVPQCIVEKGEVLVARSNTEDLVGRVSMYDGDPPGVVASDLTIRILANNGVSSRFLTAYLTFLYQTGYWKERAGGASGSMKKITRGQINKLEIPIPEKMLQDSIADHLFVQMRQTSQLRICIEDELTTIDALPAALLRRAFNGDL